MAVPQKNVINRLSTLRRRLSRQSIPTGIFMNLMRVIALPGGVKLLFFRERRAFFSAFPVDGNLRTALRSFPMHGRILPGAALSIRSRRLP